MKNDTDTLKALYKTLKSTQKRLADLESAARAPIAVIGMACRFPGGADTIDTYRALLERGDDAVCDVPRERWDARRYYDPDPEAPGKATTRRAGFLQAPLDGFDCGFFHLSPQEVQRMDPQQRMLLEVCWEAFENAGLDIAALKGSQTGVFCGIANSDYAAAHLRSGDPAKIDAYSVTGTALSAAVGRLSYLFGFEGPNMALDTACSSSLVAIHLAGRSLRGGESDLAVAAGINLIITPEGHIAFSKLGAISPDGRCKSFDDAADGYGRGEGCGVVLLKRLTEAEKDGDPVLAVIRGTAVNQDGRTNGFTAPSSRSQEKLLRQALADAGLEPEAIGYVEAHGTGTPLGDPIEMEAIGKVYAAGRSMDRPLYVGSVKANIGHLEAAAGMAGFIKAVLTLAGGRIFPQAHFKQPNRHIPWQRLSVTIPTAPTAWPQGQGPRSAAVSSFGFSGTNAHAILQAAPPAAEAQDEREKDGGRDRPHHILTLSAADPPALGALSRRYLDFLAETSAPAGDICFSAAAGRSHFPHRLAVAGRSRQELRERLEAHPAPDGAGRGDRRIVFLFTGQGSQYHRMGGDLFEAQPLFRSVMERCDALLRPHMDRSLIDLLYGADEAAVHATQYTQPVIFCVEYALAQMLAAWGITPSLVAGHSIGEYVAATLAGIFDLEQALGLVAARGRLVQSLPSGGGMAVIAADEARVRDAAAPFHGRLSIAAVNAPRNTVVSGCSAALEELCAGFKKQRVAAHRLNVSHAFHSCLLDPVVDPFRTLAAGIAYAPPRLPIMANVSGRPGGAEMAAADYWATHLRRPVRFLDSMRAMAEAGYELFLEVGGTATLTSLGRQCLAGHNARWCTTLGRSDGGANLRPRHRADRSDWEPLLGGLAGLYTAGCDIDWPAFDRPYRRRRVGLPNYPFQRKRCWMELPANRDATPDPAAAGQKAAAPGAPGPDTAPEAVPAAERRENGDRIIDYQMAQLELMDRQLTMMSGQLDMLGGQNVSIRIEKRS